MKQWQKIFGITVGIILLFFILYTFKESLPHFCWNDKPDNESEEQIRDEIVYRIDNYIELNNKLPEALSEIGFEQEPYVYKYHGHSLYLHKCWDMNYIVEYWDDEEYIWQYISEEKKWYDDPICEFEPPINIDTIQGVIRVYYSPRENMQFEFDSLRINDNVTSILDYDTEVTPDSLAYVRCYMEDALCMEGWASYRANSRPHYVKEFGEWKYYDGKGNCYRKFWNYKKDGVLIYKADW